MIEVHPHAEGCVIAVRARPGARKNAALGGRAGALRLAVTAPPDKGKANAALAALLAELLGVKASRVALLSGETSRDKRFLVAGMSPDALKEKLTAIVGNDRPDLPKGPGGKAGSHAS